MSRPGLGRFGFLPPTVVRLPATDHKDLHICAECGRSVAESKGSHELVTVEIVDEVEPIGDRFVTHGWRCGRHQHDVIMSEHAGGSTAPAMGEGWTGVRVRFADQVVRHVPVPEKEVDDGE